MTEEANSQDGQSKQPARCTQCGKPAVIEMSGVPLCIDCYAKVEYVNQLRLSRLIDLLNYTSAQIDASIGFGISPRMANFQPQPPPGALFLNNISVEKSTIGTINTGTIQSLDNAITILSDQQQGELAEALKKFTEAIIQNTELTEAARKEVVESLSFLAEQLSKPRDERKSTLVKTLFERIPTLLKTATDLVTLWKQIEPLILAALN